MRLELDYTGIDVCIYTITFMCFLISSAISYRMLTTENGTHPATTWFFFLLTAGMGWLLITDSMYLFMNNQDLAAREIRALVFRGIILAGLVQFVWRYKH